MTYKQVDAQFLKIQRPFLSHTNMEVYVDIG
jgi:hypothetical protein